MNRNAISEQVKELIAKDLHIFAKYVLSWQESYALRKHESGGLQNTRMSCAKTKLAVLTSKVKKALIKHGEHGGLNEPRDVDLYYGAVRGWVCNCFLRGYLTWGPRSKKEHPEKEWRNIPIDQVALGMMKAIDELTMSKESRLVGRMVPLLLNLIPEEKIAEELGADVEAVRQYRRRIYDAAKRKCLQDALAMEVIYNRDERWVSDLFVAGWDEGCIARELDRKKLDVTKILDKAYRTQSLSNITTEQLPELRKTMVEKAVQGYSVTTIAESMKAREEWGEERVERFLDMEARKQALTDLNRRLPQLAGWRVILLRAVAGADLADQDVADGDGVDPNEVLSTVAAIQSWVKTKYGKEKKRMREVCERGIVELQESWSQSWNVRESGSQSDCRSDCRLAAASLKWSDCGRVGDVAPCGLSRFDENQAGGQDPYAGWENCRECLPGHETLPVRNKLMVLRVVEHGVKPEYRAAARKFLIARLPGVLWWWNHQPGDNRPEREIELSEVVDLLESLKNLLEEESPGVTVARLATEGNSIATIAEQCDMKPSDVRSILGLIASARKLEDETGLSKAVDLLESLRDSYGGKSPEATVARLATEGNSIATIAGQCGMKPPDVRSILSWIASKYLERKKYGLTICWER